jgi:DNA polymerase V
MFALIDCNNFFVSCERVFRPDLEGRPVIVLSSNDGCAIARSNEAKRLGIPMGAPEFKFRDVIRDNKVVKFSANFELYGDISQRITNLLSRATPRIEVYSIDEAFLELDQLGIKDYTAWAAALKQRIWREIGVPVSIGIAPSKVLAKLASERSKKDDSLAGVLCWSQLTPAQQTATLAQTPVRDIWGIGRRLAPKLRAENIHTAADLAVTRSQLASKLMGVHGRQLVAELNGVQCLPLEQVGAVQQSIMRGRTFGEDTGQLHVLQAAITTLTTRAALRLRREGCAAAKAGVFLQTNRHKPGYRSWYLPIEFSTPTSDTGRIISQLMAEVEKSFSPNQRYHRANVYLMDFSSANRLQTDLFGTVNTTKHAREQSRMQAVDAINQRFGSRHLYYAAEDLGQSWQPKHNLRSPRYTTLWDELPTAAILE